MSKMERKKKVLLTLMNDWGKLCKESLSEVKRKNGAYMLGYVSGELNAIKIIRKFIEEIWGK